MVQILHPCASTTEATRENIQNSPKSIVKLAKNENEYKKHIQALVKGRGRETVPLEAVENSSSVSHSLLKASALAKGC